MAQEVRLREYIFDLPKIEDSRGNLSFLEQGGSIPFQIARVYWIYDVPGGQKRGSHAFKNQHEIIIALSGSFDVTLNDGQTDRKYTLNRSYKGLYIPPRMWRFMDNFATNSVCLVISSGKYDPDEYIRNFKTFKEYIKKEEYLPLALSPLPKVDSKKSLPLEYNSIDSCDVLNFPVIHNRAGNLTPVHNSLNIPFDVKRIFFVYDIPYGKKRGMHAHKHCHELIIAASGSFDVELDDTKDRKVINLNRPMQGLHVQPGIWTKEFNYSSGAICLVLTSDNYFEEDYIRKYSDYKKLYND